MVLIDMEELDTYLEGYTVSVPLRGLWFLSAPNLFRAVVAARKRFRPLAGIMVLILSHNKTLMRYIP